MAMTQMNTRIDAELKQRGDAVFSKLGLTPSEVVRAVWEYADEHGDAPAVVARALHSPRGDAVLLDVAFRLAIADEASHLVARYRQAREASPLDALEAIDYRSLREEAWAEKLAERGLA